MQTRLLLVSHAPTAAQRSGRFAGADEGLDARGHAAAAAYARQADLARGNSAALTSPAACARETAAALGLAATVCDALAETDYGSWRGRRLTELAAEASQALEAWLRDPAAAPPGGESFEAVLARVGAWLDGYAAHDDAADRSSDRTVIAITHAAVMRAAIVHTLQATSAAFAHIEIAPLTVVELRRSTRGWAWWPAQQIAPGTAREIAPGDQ
jgi:broad specificity phosphatase PhoE